MVGGTCVNTGCTPTKTLAASARDRIFDAARGRVRRPRMRGGVSVNMREVRDRAQSVVHGFSRDGTEKNVQGQGVDLIYGKATIRRAEVAGPSLLKDAPANGRILEADQNIY